LATKGYMHNVLSRKEMKLVSAYHLYLGKIS